MTAYLIRRLLTSVIVVFGVTIFVFLLLHLIYPSPAVDVLGPKATHSAILAWNKDNGFDRPWIAQYGHYMWLLLHGNLGHSFKVNQSVTALFKERFARSAYLSIISLINSWKLVCGTQPSFFLALLGSPRSVSTSVGRK